MGAHVWTIVQGKYDNIRKKREGRDGGSDDGRLEQASFRIVFAYELVITINSVLCV